MNSRFVRYLPHWGTVLSCALFVASYPPYDFHHLIWICLVPWLYTLSRCKTPKAALAQGLWLSALIGVAGFSWVAFVLHEFGEIPWPAAIFCLCVYAWANQPQLVVLAPFAFGIANRDGDSAQTPAILRALAFAFFYVGLEAILPKLFMDTLGHSLYASPWLRQGADLGGTALLSFAIALTNYAIAVAVIKSGEYEKLGRAVPAVAAAAIVAGLVIYGASREKQVTEWMAHPSSVVRGGLIQANVGDFDKLASEKGLHGASEKVLKLYFSMSDQALALQKKPDFIVWPETAYPSTFRKPFSSDDSIHDKQVVEFVRSRHVPLLFGGYDRDQGKDFNAFFLLSPDVLPSEALRPIHSDGNDLEFYRKNVLLMFGEYVPFQDQIPGFDAKFPQIGNFGRGIGPDVLSIPLPKGGLFKVSPLICYEVLYSDYVLQGANQGSQAILNITNDSWFGPTGEPYLHLALSIFRSVETRLPLVRATNTGFSALVLPDGTMIDKSDLFKAEIDNVEIPVLSPMPTLIKRWGNWFERVSLGLGIALIGGILVRKRRARRVLAA